MKMTDLSQKRHVKIETEINKYLVGKIKIVPCFHFLKRSEFLLLFAAQKISLSDIVNDKLNLRSFSVFSQHRLNFITPLPCFNVEV